MRVKITEQMIIDWLNWDSFLFDLEDVGGTIKIVARPDSSKNEFRLTNLVNYLNEQINIQVEELERNYENTCREAEAMKDKLKSLDATGTTPVGFPPTLGVHVAEKIGIQDSIGGAPPSPPELEVNAIGFLRVNPETGEIRVEKFTFIQQDMGYVKVTPGKKLLVEIR